METNPLAVAEAVGILNVCVEVELEILKSVPEVPVAKVCVVAVSEFSEVTADVIGAAFHIAFPVEVSLVKMCSLVADDTCVNALIAVCAVVDPVPPLAIDICPVVILLASNEGMSVAARDVPVVTLPFESTVTLGYVPAVTPELDKVNPEDTFAEPSKETDQDASPVADIVLGVDSWLAIKFVAFKLTVTSPVPESAPVEDTDILVPATIFVITALPDSVVLRSDLFTSPFLI